MESELKVAYTVLTPKKMIDLISLCLLFGILASVHCSFGARVDPYYIFGGRDQVVLVSDSNAQPANLFFQPISTDTVFVRIVMRRGFSVALGEDNNAVMIDLVTGPKRLRDRLCFNPDSIRIEVNGVSLTENESKKAGCSGRFNECYYRTSFRLDSARSWREPVDSRQPWCIIDLRKALMLDSIPIDLGIRYGYLPSKE